MTDDELAAIRTRVEASTPGPWDWFGSTDSDTVDLATVDRGRALLGGCMRCGSSLHLTAACSTPYRYTLPSWHAPKGDGG